MKTSILFILYFIFISYLSNAQETGLREKLIRTVLKPYEGSLDSYLEAEKEDETETRESFYSLFFNREVKVYNDVPARQDRGTTLGVNAYAQIARAYGHGKAITITLDYENILICEDLDTVLFVKKIFIVDETKSENWLKIMIRYYPLAQEDKFKILFIEKIDQVIDVDNDKIPDVCDRCPIRKGNINTHGCPDSDSDGIADDDDECKEIVGPAKFKGCPDADDDGLPLGLDDCPDIYGKKELKGCPDSDGDDIPDKDDKCPMEAGIIEFSGCPKREKVIESDRDGDGIPDIYDSCPDLRGKRESKGCPDSDNDGVPDKEDKCPFEIGIPANSGCPHKKKSKLYSPILLSTIGIGGASIGSSFYFQTKSDQYYADYKNNLTSANSGNLYDKANKVHHTKLILIYTGATLVGIGALWPIIKKIISPKPKSFSSKINIAPSTQGLSLRYSF